MSAKKNLARINFEGRGYSLRIHAKHCSVSAFLHRNAEFYEAEFLSAISNILPVDPTVLDVGAHIGNHAVFFASECNAKVYAFEPCSESRMLLEENVMLNQLHQRVSVSPSAIGEVNDRVFLAVDRTADIGTTKIVDEKSEHPCDQITLDYFARMNNIERVDFIKVDVEGRELSVLNGARELIQSYMPVISTEVTCLSELSKIEALLSKFGYVGVTVLNPTPTIVWAPFAASESRRRSFAQLVMKGVRRAVAVSTRLNEQVAKVERFDEVIAQKNKVIKEMENQRKDDIEHFNDVVSEKNKTIHSLESQRSKMMDQCNKTILEKNAELRKVAAQRAECLRVIDELRTRK